MNLFVSVLFCMNLKYVYRYVRVGMGQLVSTSETTYRENTSSIQRKT